MDWLKSLYRRLFPERTLDHVIAGFKNTLAELDVLIADREHSMKCNADTIVELQRQNHALHADCCRAVKVRENITRLIEE